MTERLRTKAQALFDRFCDLLPKIGNEKGGPDAVESLFREMEKQAIEDNKKLAELQRARLRRSRIRMTAIKLMSDYETARNDMGHRHTYIMTSKEAVKRATVIVDEVEADLDKLVPGDDPEQNPNTLH